MVAQVAQDSGVEGGGHADRLTAGRAEGKGAPREIRRANLARRAARLTLAAMLLGSAAQVLAGEARAHVAHADALDFLRSLPPACADILVTDPPYSSGGAFRGDRAVGGTVKYERTEAARSAGTAPEIEGDTRDQASWQWWCTLWLRLCRRALKPGAIAAVFADWRQDAVAQMALQAAGFVYRGKFAWTKPVSRPMLGRYSNDSEFVIWGTVGGRPMGGRAHRGHWHGSLPQAERRAICSKPIALMEHLLGPCPAGGVALDPFVGWGATPVAALRTGRRFLGCEISEANLSTALGRLAGPEVDQSLPKAAA